MQFLQTQRSLVSAIKHSLLRNYEKSGKHFLRAAKNSKNQQYIIQAAEMYLLVNKDDEFIKGIVSIFEETNAEDILVICFDQLSKYYKNKNKTYYFVFKLIRDEILEKKGMENVNLDEVDLKHAGEIFKSISEKLLKTKHGKILLLISAIFLECYDFSNDKEILELNFFKTQYVK